MYIIIRDILHYTNATLIVTIVASASFIRTMWQICNKFDSSTTLKLYYYRLQYLNEIENTTLLFCKRMIEWLQCYLTSNKYFYNNHIFLQKFLCLVCTVLQVQYILLQITKKIVIYEVTYSIWCRLTSIVEIFTHLKHLNLFLINNHLDQ